MYRAMKMKRLANKRRFERRVMSLLEMAVGDYADERKLIEATIAQKSGRFCPPPNNSTRDQN
jgi:hypothetical protein